MVRALVLLVAAFVALAPRATSASETCVMHPDDRAWLAAALDQWRMVMREELRIEDAALPDTYAVDARCTYRLPAGSFAEMEAVVHEEGFATLPGVGKVPVAPISFAFAADGFAMSLPSVWRAAGVTSEQGLETLMTGVLLHEIMHTLQARMVGEIVEPVALAAGMSSDDINDDYVQKRFADVPGYRDAYEAERDALFAAASASDEAAARGLAAHALHLMRERRARFFSGENSHFVAFDDVFLTMEGGGQWLAYDYLRSPHGGNATPEEALAETRRGGRWWTQDEGLALMLTLDRLLPDWRERMFRHPDWLAENLLAAAVGEIE